MTNKSNIIETKELPRIYKLNANYDARASFYGKAMVIELNDCITLQSYDTKVAHIICGKAHVNGTYSVTTLRHIKEFLLQNGFKAENKAQIERDYIKAGA